MKSGLPRSNESRTQVRLSDRLDLIAQFSFLRAVTLFEHYKWSRLDTGYPAIKFSRYQLPCAGVLPA
jgi:hypothetical protein